MGEDHTYRYVNASGVAGACTLLWTNPNGTDKVAFPAQTVSLNLTNYDGVLILAMGNVYHHTELPDYLGKSLTFTKKGTSRRIVGGAYQSSYGITCCWRIITVSNTGIVFDVGHSYYQESAASDNNNAVPWKIWGIKCPNLPD